ncbi:MAG: hypothetical protein QM689_08440 [Oscillospiraceae bacterium]
MGYDNYVVQNLAAPLITTFDVSITDMAAMAAETIVAKIRTGEKNNIRKTLIGRIVVKDSVKKLL